MSETLGRDLARFLDIRPEDQALVQAYAESLKGSAEALARRFYDYLLSHPETAHVFHDFDPEHLQRLTEKQADHYRRMLFPPDHEREQELAHIGAVHHQWGISPVWVVGAYRLYIEHMETQVDALPLSWEKRTAIRQALTKRVLYDMTVQLSGYERAQRHDEDERASIARVLLDATMSLPHMVTPETIFETICDRLVRVSRHLPAVWFAVLRPGEKEIHPAYASGDGSLTPHIIPSGAGDPLWDALSEGRPVVIHPQAADAPTWCHGCRGVAAIGVFPFGSHTSTGPHGVGVVYADQEDYFSRIDLSPFAAFVHLGDMLLDLKAQARRDTLTGLPNRAALTDHLEKALARAQRHKKPLAVGMLDLDDFKPVNDAYGHAMGDVLLREIGARLQQALRKDDFVCRLGGDEFVLIFEDFSQTDGLEAILHRVEATVNAPVELPNGEAVRVGSSMGITLYPFDESDPDGLLRHADQALYSVKADKERRERSWHYWRAFAGQTTTHHLCSLFQFAL